MRGSPAGSPQPMPAGRSQCLSRPRLPPRRSLGRRPGENVRSIFGRVGPLSKSVFIATYGCQMNVYDSARMLELLAPLGFVQSSAPDEPTW